MQYKFIDKIKEVFKSIENLQTVITTHSAQIVSKCDFKDIRYLLNIHENIKIKNFHSELKELYRTEEEEFQFVEPTTQHFKPQNYFLQIKLYLLREQQKKCYFHILLINLIMREDIPNYIPISSQNISILEVGANAEAFDKLVRFFDIQTLIITDIDTTLKLKIKRIKTVYTANKVEGATHTSNATIKKYFKAPDINSPDFPEWFDDLKNNALSITDTNKIKVFYQTIENNYHARSFEDAFIKVNLQKLFDNKSVLRGLKNDDKLIIRDDIYELTEEILDKKSDFAFSLLYLALSKNRARMLPEE